MAKNQEKRTDSHMARRYHKKAERLRAIASDLLGDARSALLKVAEGYDNMATRAAGSSPPEPASAPLSEQMPAEQTPQNKAYEDKRRENEASKNRARENKA